MNLERKTFKEVISFCTLSRVGDDLPVAYSCNNRDYPANDHEPLPGHEAASLPNAVSLRGARDMSCCTHMRVQQPKGNEAQEYNGEAVHEDCPCE